MEVIRYLDSREVEQLSLGQPVLVTVRRCAVVVKGGRRFSFAALQVVGNRAGVVGIGYGKGPQVPGAIEKSERDARKHLFRVPVTETGTIPHECEANFGASRVRLVPAAPGTGIIAGHSVRAVCEMAGIKNVLTKSYGSTNPVNCVKAALAALAQLRTRETVRELRGVEL